MYPWPSWLTFKRHCDTRSNHYLEMPSEPGSQSNYPSPSEKAQFLWPAPKMPIQWLQISCLCLYWTIFKYYYRLGVPKKYYWNPTFCILAHALHHKAELSPLDAPSFIYWYGPL